MISVETPDWEKICEEDMLDETNEVSELGTEQ